MKKITALILALTMVLALAACGGMSKEPSVLGEWEDDEGNYLTFSEGGFGSYTSVYNDEFNPSFSYEVKDGVVTIQYQLFMLFTTQEIHASFKLSEDGTKLVCMVGVDETFTAKGMEYTKCNGEHTHTGPEPVATITTKSGTTEKMTSKQICDLYSDNKVLFDKEYKGAKVVLEGEIDKIGGSTNADGHYMSAYIEIKDNTGWNWVVEADHASDVENLQPGDKVRATGQLFGAFVHPEIYIINGWTTTIQKIG